MTRLSRLAAIAQKAAIYALILLLLNATGLGLYSLMLGRSMMHFFTLITLLESAGFFLVGGAMDVGGSLSFRKLTNNMSKTQSEWSMEDHRQAQSSAAPLIVAGVILLVASFALAYPLN